MPLWRLAATIGWFLTAFCATHITFAEDQRVFIFWDTVSPNGKYALAWTEKGSIAPDDLPNPDEDDRGIQNWLIELESRKLILLVAHSAFWSLSISNRAASAV